MKIRDFGRTGLKVSEIGFGAWGIGGGLWRGSEDDESMKALRRALDLGLNFIDTALAYNEGHSERLICSVVRERNSDAVVATKIPPKNRIWPAAKGTRLKDAFPADYIRTCTETSLRNLGLSTLTIQQFHVWSDEWASIDEWKEAVHALKKEGKVRFFGISINDHQPENVLRTLDTGLIDCVQVIYNIFDQTPQEELFPYCLKKGIGVIVRVPFDEGGLTGRITESTVFDKKDFRHHYFRGSRKKQVAERAEKIQTIMGKEADDVAELALRFTLSHAAVSTVIPGMRTVAHVEKNTSISDGRRLSPSLLRELKEHQWRRNFYE